KRRKQRTAAGESARQDQENVERRSVPSTSKNPRLLGAAASSATKSLSGSCGRLATLAPTRATARGSPAQWAASRPAASGAPSTRAQPIRLASSWAASVWLTGSNGIVRAFSLAIRPPRVERLDRKSVV